MNTDIVLACILDSPKLHTGFANAGNPLLQGFHDAGIKVTCYGLLDHNPDTKGVLPYEFRPVPFLDDLAHETFGFFLREKKPDAIFFLTDPGNLWIYMKAIIERQQASYFKENVEVIPPVISYTPIEGVPSPQSHGEALRLVQQNGGSTVVYCNTARDAILSEFPDLQPPHVVYHGLDHFKTVRYSEEDRKLLRRLIGWEGKFVVGSIGVNKRTKGFPTIIYAAAFLRSIGQDKDLLFYLHTNPEESTMWGYKLRELVRYYGVEDIFIFKPDVRSGYWEGVERDMGTLEQARQITGEMPDTPEGRGFLFGHYDFVSRLNCLDCYVDASQIEGWGLPLGEAMACGVPSISVHDKHVRDEVYKGGCYQIDALPHHFWDTWHSGMRLVGINPHMLAKAIIEMRDDIFLRDFYSKAGMEVASRYKWADSQAKMTQIVLDTVAKDREAFRTYVSTHKGLKVLDS